MAEWISVADRLPKDGTWVLVAGRRNVIRAMMYNSLQYGYPAWMNERGEYNTVAFSSPYTHWMPLPDPPRIDEAITAGGSYPSAS